METEPSMSEKSDKAKPPGRLGTVLFGGGVGMVLLAAKATSFGLSTRNTGLLGIVFGALGVLILVVGSTLQFLRRTSP